jgi:two-component system osmolarity sensor histidine kinase EnvZ
MASPVSPERAWRPSLGRTLGYLLAGTGAAAFCLLLQLLLGRRLAQQQLVQTGSEVAANVVLGEVVLERFSPEVLGQISGMKLVVGHQPEPGAMPRLRGDRRLRWQTLRLQTELCHRLTRCPAVRPASSPRRGVWVEMASPLEPVWLFVSLPSPRGWPPDPLLLTLSVGLGALGALTLRIPFRVVLRLCNQSFHLLHVHDLGLLRTPANHAFVHVLKR